MKVNCNQNGIRKAEEIIRNGGIVIFPTDTVYGIGCNPYNSKAVQRIYKIKNRLVTKPFPVLAFSFETVSTIAKFDEKSEKVAKKIWPGALTIILELTDKKLSDNLQVKKIAIRVPNNQCLLDVLKKCKFLVGTSANMSGQSSFSKPEECFENMNGFDLFLDGGIIQNYGESTIIEFSDEKLIIHREGIIKRQEILDLL